MIMLPVKSQLSLIERVTEGKRTHGGPSWQGGWLPALHGWAVVGPSLRSVRCRHVCPRGQLPRQGGDRLVQTYSSAGSPGGSVRTRSDKLSVLALVED